ncbi:MAG: metalloregulator ArsR/SmtB family transcription factor, partial [bacterium]|nr:metalloregulator ArsR/SmtB family transcription factor [bacterium]
SLLYTLYNSRELYSVRITCYSGVMKRWTQIFKALGNVNRLKIIKLLSDKAPMTVTDISGELEISFRATSQHLIILHGLDILTNEGKEGHVYYGYNRIMPSEIKKVVEIFLRTK